MYFLFIPHVTCRLAGDSGKSIILGRWMLENLLAFKCITWDNLLHHSSRESGVVNDQ